MKFVKLVFSRRSNGIGCVPYMCPTQNFARRHFSILLAYSASEPNQINFLSLSKEQRHLMCVKEPGSKHQHESSSAESTPPPSRPSSRSDLNKMASPSISNKTLASRSKVPFSMYIIVFVIFGSQNSGGVYTSEVFQSVIHSLKTSAVALATYCEYLRDLTKAVATGRTTEPHEVITSAFATAFASAVLYILLYIPFRAGMWTGQRARRHKVHRYMGLSFLILYFAAWIEFFANYENGGKDSYLAHFISLNGKDIFNPSTI